MCLSTVCRCLVRFLCSVQTTNADARKLYSRAFLLPFAEHALANDLKERCRKRKHHYVCLVHGGLPTRVMDILNGLVLCACWESVRRLRGVRSSIDACGVFVSLPGDFLGFRRLRMRMSLRLRMDEEVVTAAGFVTLTGRHRVSSLGLSWLSAVCFC